MSKDNYGESLYQSLPEAEGDMANNESFSSSVEPKPWQRTYFGFETQDDLFNVKGRTLNILDKLEEKNLSPKDENNNSWLIQKKYNDLVKKISKGFEDSIGTKIKDFFSSLKHNIENIKTRIVNFVSNIKNKISGKNQDVKDWKKSLNDEESISTSVKKIFG